MAQFSVKPDNAQKTVADEEKFILELARFEDEVHHISNSLGFHITSSANIRGRLQNAADNLEGHQNSMNSMKVALNDSLNMYRNTENAILGNLDVGNAPEITIPVISGDVVDIENELSGGEQWWDSISPWLNAFGAAGDVAAFLGDCLTGDITTGATWADMIKDGWDLAWDVGDAVKRCSEDTSVKWWKELFKFNPDDFLNKISKADLSKFEKFNHGWDKKIKGTFREFKTVGGAAKQVGGIILSGVGNYFDNREEFERGEITEDRMWVETISETAVDWGKDLLIGAGATAAFAAAGIAAPAVAVGAATVAVSVAADWVCEQICGKKVTELVSDAIVDVGYKIKDDVVTLWSNISDGWNMFTGGIGKVFA